ncbi:MAG: hypothetical protein PHS41_12765 [Victivallaceae bacterium]|nr:hypothetical protein [Victivallaceae bacterium]
MNHHTILLSAALLGAAALAAGTPVAEFPGVIPGKNGQWSFEPSRPQGGMTYNPFEGYYPDKGGKLVSPLISLPKNPGEGRYYRMEFEAQAPECSFAAIDFFTADGKKLPDNYDVVYPGMRQKYDRVFYAMPSVAAIRVFFQSQKGIQAWNLKITECTADFAAEYCDRVYQALPALKFSASPATGIDRLPKTRAALETGKKIRIVLLGDSIMQDLFHSQFHALLARKYPKAKMEFVISMRGSTGCWFYCQEQNFREYVTAAKPDLLLIGGISNYKKGQTPDGTEAIALVAERARKELGCEVGLLTAALSIDSRTTGQPAAYDPAKDSFALAHTDLQGLRTLAEHEHYAFFDLTTPCYTWLFASGLPKGFYSRDAVHSGEKGKQVIGRALLGGL